MPSRPPTVCPTCGTPTKGRCPRCSSRYDQARGTATSRGYDRVWKDLRVHLLRGSPWCTAPGCTAPATEVDHIVSVRDAPERRLDPTNLRTLCKPCHSSRTWHDQGQGRHTRDS